MGRQEITNEDLDGSPWPKNGIWFGALVAGLVGAVLLGGLLVSTSFASAGGMFGRGHSRWHHGSADPEEAQERAEYAAQWVLRYVDASEEQHAEVNAIIERSVAELTGLRDTHAENRTALVAAFRQVEIDRAELETIRQAELAVADSASRELVAAFADLAEVLTPEQRAELLELSDRFHH